MNTENKEKIEAAVFRRLLNHLQENTDLQNIDLMNLAGFCRNCLSKWYVEASKENGQEINYDKAKEIVYSCHIMNGKKNIKNNPIFYDILYTNSQTLKVLVSNWFLVETLVLFYFFQYQQKFFNVSWLH